MFILDRLVDKIERFAEVVSILPSRFPDPATQYAYFLFDSHDSIMSYIFFTLILVYWVSLKIIQDHTWLLYKNFFKNIAIFYYIRVIIEYIIYNLTSFLGSRAWSFYNFIEAYRAYIIVTKRFRYFVPKRIREYFYPEFLYSNWPTLGSNFYTYLWKAFVSLCIITLIPFALVPIVLCGYQYRNKFIRYQLFVRRTSTRNIMNIYRLPLFKNESKYLFHNRYWRIYRQNYFSLRKVKSLLPTSFIDTINYHYMTNSYFYNNYIHINKLHDIRVNIHTQRLVCV